MIEKILAQIDENTLTKESVYFLNAHGIKLVSASKMKEIVQEAAKEYGKDTNVPSNGWIPYSERLPEKDQRCLVQYNGAMSGFEDYMDVDTYNGEMFEFFGSKYVVAWQPLPSSYQKGDHA